MHNSKVNYLNNASIPTALYTSQQVYAIEQAWFDKGYDSFALMQQAAWQMTQMIIKLQAAKNLQKFESSTVNTRVRDDRKSHQNNGSKRAVVWVGSGNNGGDGWLIALYLQQAGWQVNVLTVGIDDIKKSKDINSVKHCATIADAKKALDMAVAAQVSYGCFEDNTYDEASFLDIDVYVDAMLGIGFNRAPSKLFRQAIDIFNYRAHQTNALVVSVDIPSGLIASTGQVFDSIAIRANVTLCLIARKIGLHIKDGMDYAGQTIDIPLIPIEPSKYKTNNGSTVTTATLLKAPYPCMARQKNSYKGSYGHVLVIGGNRINDSQGMGGAALLAASSAMVTGAGKITIACHNAFHGAVISSLPDAMTIDLHDKEGVSHLIKEATVIAVGMGLGRDKTAQDLFVNYLQTAITQKKAIVIDADGLYHLATLYRENNELVKQLKAHSQNFRVSLTPHSGEAARLLNTEVVEVENNRLNAIERCATIYGGDWVLKGAGSLVLERHDNCNNIYVCEVGNAGMATAGMGDVLAGTTAGLLAQQDLVDEQSSLRQAVLIHGAAGTALVDNAFDTNKPLAFYTGERGLQAQDMPAAIRHVMSLLQR